MAKLTTENVTLEALNALAAAEQEAATESQTVYAETVAPEVQATSTYPNVQALITHLGTLDVNELVGISYVIGELQKIKPARSTSKASSGERRGQLQGLAVENMTDEQLKREKINSDSVLYKATQRGAAAETIAKNQARVDACAAEKAKRTPAAVVVPAAEIAPVTAEQEAAVTAEV